jgi:hypothetical protein
MKGNRPDLYGLVTTGNKAEGFKRIGKIAIWKQHPRPASKRPPFKGNLELNGRRYRIAIWEQLGM